MRNVCVVPVLLAASAGVTAQHATATKPAAIATPAMVTGCPVAFGAEVDGRARAQAIGDQEKRRDAPLLRLFFGRLDAPKIVGASVTVHGRVASSRYLPVGVRSDAERTQSFELDRDLGPMGLTEREVSVTKMAFVRWADVTELRYADGSVWHESGDAQCRAVPSGFRLVDAAAR